MSRTVLLCLALVWSSAWALSACGLDSGGDGSAPAGDVGFDRTRDIPIVPDAEEGGADGSDAIDEGDAEVQDVPTEEPDVEPDVTDDATDDPEIDPNLTCLNDADNDGHYATVCGGDDCAAHNVNVHGGLLEACDFFDNDCDDVVNDGITCTFFAHTDEFLYEVDPFLFEVTEVVALPDAYEMWDIDTHPDGTLYGVSEGALYRFDAGLNDWVDLGALDHSGGDANGMAIDLDGIAYLTGGDNLYTIDLESAETSLVGAMGGGFISSGDCVVDKGNSLYMTSKHLTGTDTLIFINGETGVGSVVGNIGFERIFGLTAAWGHLFGLSSNGDLIEIDVTTGQGRFVHNFTDFRWLGAASSPSR